jgi:hypothetical protein
MQPAQTLTVDLAAARKWLSTPALDYVIAGVLALMAVFGSASLIPLALGLLATLPQAIGRRHPVTMLGLTLLGGLGVGFCALNPYWPLYGEWTALRPRSAPADTA